MAVCLLQSNYYPFGMVAPGRTYNADNYRYGFNGKEKDKDISAGDLDFGARIYDGRIGRWLSTDPLEAKYPFASPYNFALNNALSFIDPNGQDIILATQFPSDTWTTFLNKTFEGNVSFRIETDNEGVHRLKLDLIQGRSFTSEAQRKAYEYIKSIADNSATNVKIGESGLAYSWKDSGSPYLQDEWNVGPDSYKTAEINSQILGVTHDDGFGYNGKGTFFIHFLAEQYSAQVEQGLTREAQRDDYNYNGSHEAGLNKGLEIFGFKWGERIDLPIGKGKIISDEDIIDKDGNYVITLRRVHDFTGKQPKYSNYTFERKGIKKGDKWTGPVVNNSMSTKEYQETRIKYLKDNPHVEKKKPSENEKPNKKAKSK